MSDFLKVYFVKNQFYLVISIWGVTSAQLVASAGEPEVLKVRLGVRFPLATTHPV